MTSRPPKARIDRASLGASRAPRNPTVTLFVAMIGGYAAGVAAALAGVVPLWLAIPWLAICLYAGFTMLHESVHGIAHRSNSPPRADLA